MTDTYDALEALRLEYPELTFNNDGYEELPRAVKEANAHGIKRIEEVLKQAMPAFIRFQNFKPRKDGSITVRCQTRWPPYFVGACYIPMEDFKVLRDNIKEQ